MAYKRSGVRIPPGPLKKTVEDGLLFFLGLFQVTHRVLGDAILPDFKVKVNPGRSSGRSHLSNRLTLRNGLARRNIKLITMSVKSRKTIAVINNDCLAEPLRQPVKVTVPPSAAKIPREARLAISIPLWYQRNPWVILPPAGQTKAPVPVTAPA